MPPSCRAAATRSRRSGCCASRRTGSSPPASSIENMFARSTDVGEIVAKDAARIAETVTMAITLFLELWMLLPNVPQVDQRERLKWTTALFEEARRYGAPAPVAESAGADA